MTTVNKALSAGARKRIRMDNMAGYGFIMPWLIGFVCFTMIPILYSLFLSFTKYNMLGSPEWIGLKNFKNMFSDPVFKQSLGITFKYVFILVPVRLTFSLAVAMVLVTNHKGIGLYRTIYYIPSLLGGSVAVAIIWSQLFSSGGAVNGIIAKVFGGVHDFNWIGEKSSALYMLILMGVWHFGSSMLVFVSGLKQIPVNYYEAAQLDGASPLQKLRYVTLPMLSPIIFFNLVMGIINAFKSFTDSLIITNGGPRNATMLFALYIYKNGFTYFKMGYACAMSWLLLVIIGFFSLLTFRSSDSWVHYER